MNSVWKVTFSMLQSSGIWCHANSYVGSNTLEESATSIPSDTLVSHDIPEGHNLKKIIGPFIPLQSFWFLLLVKLEWIQHRQSNLTGPAQMVHPYLFIEICKHALSETLYYFSVFLKHYTMYKVQMQGSTKYNIPSPESYRFECYYHYSQIISSPCSTYVPREGDHPGCHCGCIAGWIFNARICTYWWHRCSSHFISIQSNGRIQSTRWARPPQGLLLP